MSSPSTAAPLDGASIEGARAPAPTATEPTPSTERPTSLGSRFRRPETLLSFAVAIAIVVFFVRRLDIDPAAVWRNVREARLWELALAVGIYYSTFALRAYRWRWLLRRAETDPAAVAALPSPRRLLDIVLVSWFVNCVVPAKLGDAYRCYLLKRESRSSYGVGFGTILAERLTDLAVLFATMAAMGAIAFRGHLPSEASRAMTVGLVLIALGFLGVAALWFGRHTIERRLPDRIRGHYGAFHGAIFTSLRRPARPVGIAILIWAGDGLRLYLVADSLCADLSYPTASFVALMSALLTILPVTPAGLGVVEVAMVAVLKLVDVDVDLAGSIALLDRLITYWSLIGVGLVLYVRRLRRDVAEPSLVG